MKIGAFIEKGPMDWQIIQQVNGKGEINLSGSWTTTPEQTDWIRVFVRIVREDTGAEILPWQPSEDTGEQKWSISLKNIPAGGLYRLETCLCPIDSRVYEWGIRGDMVHQIGVGDLYVIAGQSNSAGYGKDPVYDPSELGIHLLKNSGKWDLASHPMNESTNTIHEANREGANPGHSPYLSFAKQLKRELGYPIGLIQASLGGSPLSAWNPEEDGVLYRNMLGILDSQGKKIKGVLWYQGCSDTGEGLCDTYLKRFGEMVSHLREDLDVKTLPILTVQLNRLVSPSSKASDTGWGKVREAQRQAARKIRNVFVIPSTDSTLSDAIHNSSAANLVLGERLAGAALRNIYGKNSGFQAPDLKEARKIESNKVKLSFENVCNRLYAFEIGAELLPFTLEDEKGIIGINSYELSGVDSIILVLEREIEGNCQVHGAWEQNPKHVIPVDYASHMPILSFYGVQVR